MGSPARGSLSAGPRFEDNSVGVMTTIVAFVVVLGVLIFVHELGHFITAKLAKIAVPRFSIGLGPKILGVTIGETEYVLSALPLGGYVKMAGMGGDEATEAIEGGGDDLDVPPERRFDSKPVWVRAVVISAGVIMNFMFAVVVFGVLSYQQGDVAPVVGKVMPGSFAAAAGIQPGDRITTADGQQISRAERLGRYIRDKGEGVVELGIERGSQQLVLSTEIGRVVNVDSATGDTSIYQGIGVGWDLSARVQIGGLEAIGSGWRQTVFWSRLILDFLGGFFVGRSSFRELGGPLTIGQLSGEAARAGVGVLLSFMAILSVNLAILNLLPIPILDGGHLIFLAIEAVRGRALSVEARAKASQVGFIFILALMAWALTSDLLRLTGN